MIVIIEQVRAAAREGGVWLALIVGVVALTLTAIAQFNPAEEPVRQVGGAIGLMPESVTATAICGYPETELYEVTSAEGVFFAGVYTRGDLRYDLTWYADASLVAVEEQRGRSFNFWTDSLDQAFADCVATRGLTPVEVGH